MVIPCSRRKSGGSAKNPGKLNKSVTNAGGGICRSSMACAGGWSLLSCAIRIGMLSCSSVNLAWKRCDGSEAIFKSHCLEINTAQADCGSASDKWVSLEEGRSFHGLSDQCKSKSASKEMHCMAISCSAPTNKSIHSWKQTCRLHLLDPFDMHDLN